jgi:hypothetical protein
MRFVRPGLSEGIMTDEQLLNELWRLQELIMDLRHQISLRVLAPIKDEVEEAFEDCAATYEKDEEPKLTRKGEEHGTGRP